MQPLSASSLCARPLAAVRAELWGSGSGPFLPSIQSFLVALKVKKKEKRQTAVVHKEESSHGELVANAAQFSSSLEKLVFRKAGTTGKKSKIFAREQVGQCSCWWVWCLCDVDVCVLSMYACE